MRGASPRRERPYRSRKSQNTVENLNSQVRGARAWTFPERRSCHQINLLGAARSLEGLDHGGTGLVRRKYSVSATVRRTFQCCVLLTVAQTQNFWQAHRPQPPAVLISDFVQHRRHSLAGRAPFSPVVHEHGQLGLQHLFFETRMIHGGKLPLSAGWVDSRGEIADIRSDPISRGTRRDRDLRQCRLFRETVVCP